LFFWRNSGDPSFVFQFGFLAKMSIARHGIYNGAISANIPEKFPNKGSPYTNLISFWHNLGVDLDWCKRSHDSA
jgi:hypothetical protein